MWLSVAIAALTFLLGFFASRIAHTFRLTTARQVLADIDMAARGMSDTQRTRLWDILSALRGPDYDFPAKPEGFPASQFNFAQDYKESTTAVIRHAALPYLASRAVNVMVHLDNRYLADWRAKHRFDDIHFINHAERAFDALGLKWNSPN